MFEGIVIGLAPIVRIEDQGKLRRLTIDLKGLVRDVPKGGSVGVNGTCLTTVAQEGSLFSFDVIDETLLKTNLGLQKEGDRVNIELPLKWGGEINGHLVQGHVDTTATVVDKRFEGEDCRMWFEVPEEHHRLMVEKGSVAIDGVSLTIVDVDRQRCRISVALIPYTLEVTTLGFRELGDKVNIEVDHSAKLMFASFAPMLDEMRREIAELKRKVGLA